MSWEQTELELVRLRKEFYEFYEQHDLKEIRDSEQCQTWLKAKRSESVVIHNRRIELNIQRYK